MSKMNYIVMGIAGAAIGFLGGASLHKYFGDPVNVTSSDVNQDGRNDYVIEKRVAVPFVLIQQPDGTYRNLEEHLEFQSEKSEAQIDAERKNIGERVKHLGSSN